MTLLGSQHKERFEQLKADVNTRQSEWWFYRSGTKTIAPCLKLMLDMIRTDFLNVGPFSPYFVKENRSNFKPDFYNIPLQHLFVDDLFSSFSAFASVATCGENSILLKSMFDYFRNPDNAEDFAELKYSAICAQTAINHVGEKMVVSIDCIKNLKPLAFYEHPPNGRVLLATTDDDPPEYTALSFYGTYVEPNKPMPRVLVEVTNYYNEYELGNVEEIDLSTFLYSHFQN